MLPPYIIEQIRKREEDLAHEQPVIQLPLPEPRRPRAPQPAAPSGGSGPSGGGGPEDGGQRGVVIIDLG